MICTVADLRTPPPPPRPNARKHPRFELMAGVEVHTGDETLVLPARNLSLGGIFLTADGNDLSRLALGTTVELLVFNAADESHPAVRAHAEVVRHDDSGVGLRWREGTDAKQLSSLLEALRPSPVERP